MRSESFCCSLRRRNYLKKLFLPFFFEPKTFTILVCGSSKNSCVFFAD